MSSIGLVLHARRRSSVSRRAIRLFADGSIWAAALAAATLARFDFELRAVAVSGLLSSIALVVAIQWIVGSVNGLYRGGWRLGSFDEVAPLSFAALSAALGLAAVDLETVPTRWIPLGACLGGSSLALVLMFAARALFRAAIESGIRARVRTRTPMLVFGAGEAGAQIVASLMRGAPGPYVPVGLLDDDKAKRHLRIMGVPVLGDRSQIADVAGRTGAEALLIAIPSASGELIRSLTELAEAAGLAVKVLPSLAELLGEQVEAGDIRDITPADLLGRRQVETDLTTIASYIRGKRVLVTGAGGSIGSELCRQLVQFDPAELIMLDRDESALHATQLSIEGRALLDSNGLVLADIRDSEVINRIFARRRPEVVFHAAALKHVTLLERHPGEGAKTNVLGTLNVLEAAHSVGVQRFVNISTDKAADPTNVLGRTKRIAERLTAYFAERTGGSYLSVRFGNVLGSRGSMLGAFQTQVEMGGPVTVTHPDVTRYFMTVQEAVQLVIQAGAIGVGGQVMVLDMGTPVRIASVAELLIRRSGKDVKIEYTGLRPGEKMHERCYGELERSEPAAHPLISTVAVPALEPVLLGGLDPSTDRVAEELASLAMVGIWGESLGRVIRLVPSDDAAVARHARR